MRIVAALCAVLLLVVGCGQQPGRQVPGAPSSPPASTSVPSEPSAGPVKTLRGKVEAGVEAGCLVLSTKDGMYLLFGETAKLKPGDEAEVTGRVGTDVASFCQQGTPFVVEDVRPR